MTDLDGKPPYSGAPPASGGLSAASLAEAAAAASALHVGRQSYESAPREWTSIGQFDTALDRARLWDVVADVAGWPQWWHDLAAISCDGPVAEDGPLRGRLRGLPAMRGRIRAVEAGERMALQLTFGTVLVDVDVMLANNGDGGTRIVERICMLGWGARLAGRRFERVRVEDFGRAATMLISLAVVAAHRGEPAA